MKKITKLFALVVSASVFFAGCAKDDDSSDFKNYTISYVSKVDGYKASYEKLSLGASDEKIYFHYNVDKPILPFYTYTMEIHKDSENGELLKTLNFAGEDIENATGIGVMIQPIKNTKNSDIPNFGKNDLCSVLTKVEKPAITFNFSVADSVTTIPAGFEAVAVISDKWAIKKGGSYTVSDFSSALKDSINLAIIKEGLVQDNSIPKAGSENFKLDWKATLKINGISKETSSDDAIYLKDPELFGRNNLGKNKTVSIELNSFVKE